MCIRDRRYPVQMPLSGKFNVYNTLAAIGVLLAEGLPLENILQHLAEAPQVAGRFERVEAGQPFAVVVDYAHTPDGLENLLTTARGITQGRIITVSVSYTHLDVYKRQSRYCAQANWPVW